MIGAAIRAILLASPAVSGEVGGSRIYPHLAPQGSVMPAITYTTRAEPLSNQVGMQGLDRYEIGLDCWVREAPGSSGYDRAHSLARSVAQALSGYRGTVHGMQIQSFIVEGIYDDGLDDETGLYSSGVDAIVWAQGA